MADNTLTPSRRTAIAGIGAIPVLALLGASANATTADPTEVAYQQWRELNRRSANSNLSDFDWAMVDRAEIAVMYCTDTTPRAAERKLWIALMHDMAAAEFAPLILAEDINRLHMMSAKLDWTHRLQISAIMSLKGA